jgi:hypothetical protein
MEKHLTSPPKRSRKSVLFGIGFIAASFLLVYSYRYDLILALPSVQTDRLRLILKDTQLPFPPSSRVVKFSELPLQGPYRDWQYYGVSWLVYWESWRRYGVRWYQDDLDSWSAKIVIPESSYAEFKEAVSKKPVSPFQSGPYGVWDMWRKPVDPEFDRIVVGRGEVDCVEIIAKREDGRYSIFVGYECK